MTRPFQAQCGWPHLSPFTAYSYGCGCQRCVSFMRLYRKQYRDEHPDLAVYQHEYHKHYRRKSKPPIYGPPKPKRVKGPPKKRGPKPKPMPPPMPYPRKPSW